MRAKYRLLLYWMLLAAGVVVTAVVAWHLGFFRQLIDNDVSRLSSIIILVFLIASAHAAIALIRLSRGVEAVKGIRSDPVAAAPGRQPDLMSDSTLTAELRQHINELLRGRKHDDPYLLLRQTRLLESLKERIKAPVRLGWMLADLLIKLGLLGTVIGFILMLGAISEAESIDVSNIQPLLTDMGAGMRVALLTTLCGLVGGTLLGFQYFIVERAADELINTVTDFSLPDDPGA